MPRNHSFNAKAGKGRGASPVNPWSDEDEFDVEAEAVGKAGEGDNEALLEALKSRTCGTIAMKAAQLKKFADYAVAITVRIQLGAMAGPDVQAILERAGNASGTAKAVAQVVLDVSSLPITPPKAHQVRKDKMWAAFQVLVQLVEKARVKVRAPPRPPPSRCVTLTPPTHPPTHPPSRAPAGPRSQVKTDKAKKEKDSDRLLKLASSNGNLQCDVPTKARV